MRELQKKALQGSFERQYKQPLFILGKNKEQKEKREISLSPPPFEPVTPRR